MNWRGTHEREGDDGLETGCHTGCRWLGRSCRESADCLTGGDVVIARSFVFPMSCRLENRGLDNLLLTTYLR